MFASDLRSSDCAMGPMGMVLCGVSSCRCRRLEDELSISCWSFRTNSTRIGSKVGEFMFPPYERIVSPQKKIAGRSFKSTQRNGWEPVGNSVARHQSVQSGPVSLNDVLLYMGGSSTTMPWYTILIHIGVMNINVHKLFLFENQVSRVLIHSGPFRPERHQTIVASNFADYWFWMIKSAWNQALPCWIIHDHPTSQIPRPKSWRGEPVPIEQWMAGLGCTHGATHSGDFRGCKTS